MGEVVLCVEEDQVVAGAAVQPVAPRAADDGVVAAAAGNRVVAAPRIEVVSAASRRGHRVVALAENRRLELARRKV